MTAEHLKFRGAGNVKKNDRFSKPRPRPRVVPEQRPKVDGLLLTRGGSRFRVQGVTYGPFAPGAGDEQPFPLRDRVAADFEAMRAAGVNSLRTYHPPPEWLLALAEEHALSILVDVPWRKHVCFLDSVEARRETREAVRRVVERCRHWRSLLGYSIGNEIPPEVVRWHGAGRTERFLAELADVARQADPEGLITYGNYPSTEYLQLPFLDFVTFNVYLHDRETFRRYLFRLQNLVGEKPLLLGELGMDTQRHGEFEQANFLAGHTSEVRLMGLAGAFVFSWTDDWFTGGHAITDWAFGITRTDRSPKAAYHALREVFEASPAELLSTTPRVSVVVCSYNGGRTLNQCLRSLENLDYPDFEVILVDDGSTDHTESILVRHPQVRAIHQSNLGLSAARNVGLKAATGEVVAYTDSDCFADRDWLSHLVYQLQRSGAAAVGGPNLTPEDGWLAACVAAAPGQPTHVLESNQVAEHIPGCNMAFRREALLAINGFDPLYRKAGDDVDVCWRLQQAGMWITFAPAAFVWHHRRQGPLSYLRQQAGYGQAEALLTFHHPERFNSRGEGKWRGNLYGAALRGVRLGTALVYRGTFGTAMFQCLYQPRPAYWAMLPATLEWHLAALIALPLGLIWWPAFAIAAGMLALSIVVALVQASQAQLARKHRGLSAWLLVAGLCYAQPLVRSWKRHWTRLLAARPAPPPLEGRIGPRQRFPFAGRKTVAYWGEHAQERTCLLVNAVARLEARRWDKLIDAGWQDWDLRINCTRWSMVQVRTAQENHGAGKHLIRVRYQLEAKNTARAVVLAGLTVAVGFDRVSMVAAGAIATAILAAFLVIWWRGLRRAREVTNLFDAAAVDLGLVTCPSSDSERGSPAL